MPKLSCRAVVGAATLAVLAVGLPAGPAPAAPAPVAAAPGGTAPGAPTGLTVEDQVRPLDTDLTPRFGWLPQDADGNEVQTGYQLRVEDADGEQVWDSGKVDSDQQAYVDYDGAALEPGTAYRWTVRTWDKDGQESPWSEPATFETGLGDEDWGGAAWIRRPPGDPDSTGPLSLVDERLRVTGSAGQQVTIARTGSGWEDYVFSAKVTVVENAAAVVFRARDHRTGYMWQLHDADDALKTHRMIDGGFPRDARRTVPFEVTAGTTYDLSIRVEGQTFTTSIDGEVVDTWTDPDATGSTAGTIGFRQATGSRGAEVAEVDDVLVTSLDGATVLLEDDFSGDLAGWDSGAPTREADEYTLARTEVDVPEGEIVRARSYLAASHTAELYLDGERADRMSNYGHPTEGYYQTADVTDLVEPGETLAVGAMLHWFSSGQGRVGAEPGLLLRLELQYADGTEHVVVSDGSWKVRRGPYRLVGTRNGEGLYVEHLEGDVARAIGDWKAVGYDDSAWADAVVLGEHPVPPFTRIVAQQTDMQETVVHPERILVADDGTPVADFGKVIPGRPGVHFEDGVAGRVVPMRASLELADDGRVSTAGTSTQGTNMSWPYTQAAGAQDYQAFGHLAFRYLEIPDAGEEITVEDVTATVVHVDYPDGGAATFDSSDPTLDAVWDLMQRSLVYSVQETFVDTPTREQGQFLHDTVNISYGLMATQRERVATRQAIREFMFSQERWWSSTPEDEGRYNAVYPNGDGKRDIPDFTEVVPDWIWRYYLETGDREVLADVHEELAATAGYIRRHIASDGPTEGLVTRLTGGGGAYLYGIVDWPEHGRFGYDMSAAARTTVNALGVDVLRKVALVAEALGRPDTEVQGYRDDADALADRMNETLRRPDGTYVDGLLEDGTQSPHAGQHATSYAVAFGIAPAEDLPELGQYLASLGMRQGPMTAHFLLEALAASGAGEGLLRLLTNEDDYGWAGWLAQGGTFTPEAWELSGSANSASHGWGAMGIVDILDSVLGIEITAPGAAELRIGVPDTGLRRASGTQVTQRGPVSSQWRRADGGVTLTTEVPVNVSAVVELPASADRAYDVTGPDGAEAEELGTDDGVTSYRIGSGRWTFSNADGPDDRLAASLTPLRLRGTTGVYRLGIDANRPARADVTVTSTRPRVVAPRDVVVTGKGAQRRVEIRPRGKGTSVVRVTVTLGDRRVTKVVTVVRGGGRADRITGTRGRDLLVGGPGADRLVGGAGADLLAGGGGRDVLRGGGGVDHLAGGPGADRVFGGPSGDVFHGPRRGDRWPDFDRRSGDRRQG
ncbi:family 78 glycoside hydrolase catalytic domain [Nocardioides sp. TF02-7]|uniref:family 78 glycoside hydrolase catalytic domain n=1 Tax=Nocardioides sp. TF02-7 TaxID=2917724 RepID=UPI001F061AF5|nr:family 78 glycoside hydrolase catalytic domain [Nocardioides sp. TF02-7]UMG94497.1 family 78 glycoside hydrolase catalytic domain [Nocardioides sp. TF02-7]